mmetsp:Transcript_19953/g.47283  ORF Transcript_19953/g.47283 Transcript_19953/m.47283 type:complete len:223 (-) Transcript_19953:256-924(-)
MADPKARPAMTGSIGGTCNRTRPPALWCWASTSAAPRASATTSVALSRPRVVWGGTSVARTPSQACSTCSRSIARGSTPNASWASAPPTAASRVTGSTATRPRACSRPWSVTAAPSTSGARTFPPRSSSSWNTSSAAQPWSQRPRRHLARTCAARPRPRLTSGRRLRSSSMAPRTSASSSRRASPPSRPCSAAACPARCSTCPARTTTASTRRTRSCGTRPC